MCFRTHHVIQRLSGTSFFHFPEWHLLLSWFLQGDHLDRTLLKDKQCTLTYDHRWLQSCACVRRDHHMACDGLSFIAISNHCMVDLCTINAQTKWHLRLKDSIRKSDNIIPRHDKYKYEITKQSHSISLCLPLSSVSQCGALWLVKATVV